MTCNHLTCRQGRDCPDATIATRALWLRARARFAVVRTWFLRVLVSWLMLTGFLPRPLLVVWLEWLHECLHPQHPGMDLVLAELAATREQCRG